jgi:hypothetical protein
MTYTEAVEKYGGKRAAARALGISYGTLCYRLDPVEANARRKQRREADPRRNHAYQVNYKFGITLEEYEAALAMGCAICGTSDGQMDLDHDHDTGRIRAALCHKCNKALGLFRDDPELLREAVNYLEKHRG